MSTGNANACARRPAGEVEWVESNGRGGYAYGTLGGHRTRRYQGLLVVARHPPHDRVMLVNGTEECVMVGGVEVPLWPAPEGFEFRPGPPPAWGLRAGGVQIERAVACPRGLDAVVLRWVARGPRGVDTVLRVRPMLTGRSYDGVLSHSTVDDAGFETVPGGAAFAFRQGMPVLVGRASAGRYRHAPAWHGPVEYPVDRARGEPWAEECWSPGEWVLPLRVDVPVYLVFSCGASEIDPAAVFERERERRARQASRVARGDPLWDALAGEAETYLCDHGSPACILAGYPWFGPWTRDTFTALSGLLLSTGREETALRVLETFAGLVHDGAMPNNLPGPGAPARWNAIDSPLWFAIAAGQFRDRTADEGPLARRVYPAVRAVIERFERGLPYGGRLAFDGLVTGSAPDAPLTWMDAKYGDFVVTPRRGKPVEVQAQWIAALRATGSLARALRDGGFALRCEVAADRAARAFRQRFWCERAGYLFDVVDGPAGDDASLRPNQLFAVSLCPGLLDPARAQRAVDAVRRRLLTPRGVRSLAPGEPGYRAHYVGDRPHRDRAYHQGSAWPFLLGPMAAAWVHSHGGSAESRREARGMLELMNGIVGAACVRHACEIFDAEPPQAPRGCVAQAWSAGEVLGVLDRLGLRNVESVAARTALAPPREAVTPRAAVFHEHAEVQS